MTPITINRATVEQALEALEDLRVWRVKQSMAITALRAALAQQAGPDAYGYASRLAVAIWEKHYKDTAPQWKPLDDLMGVLTQIDNMTSGLTRLAQQAEPVEKPVDVGLLEYRGNSVAFIHQKMTAYRTGIDAAWDAFRTKGLHPDGKTSLVDMIAKYTAPPQRKPLTDDEIYHATGHCGVSEHTAIKIARAVKQASWEKNHG